MSSEALLENPALFVGNRDSDGAYLDQDELARRYLDAAEGTRREGIAIVKGHLFKVVHKVRQHTALREALLDARDLAAVRDVVDRIADAGWEQPGHSLPGGGFRSECSWYHRHRTAEAVGEQRAAERAERPPPSRERRRGAQRRERRRGRSAARRSSGSRSTRGRRRGRRWRHKIFSHAEKSGNDAQRSQARTAPPTSQLSELLFDACPRRSYLGVRPRRRAGPACVGGVVDPLLRLGGGPDAPRGPHTRDHGGFGRPPGRWGCAAGARGERDEPRLRDDAAEGRGEGRRAAGVVAGAGGVSKTSSTTACQLALNNKFSSDPNVNLIPSIRSEFDFSKLRDDLNLLTSVFDEQTQLTTDRLTRAILYDLTELENASRFKNNEEPVRTEKKVQNVAKWFVKLDGDFATLLSYFA